MKWSDAVELFGIPRMYQRVSLAYSDFIPNGIVDLGRKWVNMHPKPSIIISGCVGCGKTHFVTSMLRELIDKGWEGVQYKKSDELDKQLLDACMGNLFNAKGFQIFERDLLDRYSECPILFIDDLGCEKNTDRLIQQYYTIIDRRTTAFLPTVITTNLKLEDIAITLGERIASRLQLSKTIKFPKEDLRPKVKQVEL